MKDYALNPYMQYFRDTSVSIDKDKCAFIYVSDNLSEYHYEKKKFAYLSIFVQQMRELIESGYNTFFFKINIFDSYVLSFIEQTIFLTKKMFCKIKIYGFTFEDNESIPFYISSNCTMIHLKHAPVDLGHFLKDSSQIGKKYYLFETKQSYDNEKKLCEELSKYTSLIIGVISTKDKIIKETSLNKCKKIRINNSKREIPTNVLLNCTLTAMLARDKVLSPSEIKKIQEQLKHTGLKNAYRYFPIDSEIQFTISIPFEFNINDMYNDNFSTCMDIFNQFQQRLESGKLKYFFGFHHLRKNQFSEWEIGKSLYLDEILNLNL